MRSSKKSDPVIHYADGEIEEFEGTPVPRFLKWVYLILPIWGIIWFWLYWDGSSGWLDKGTWFKLEEAANTTFPFEPKEGADPAKGNLE
jgi:hypothetical protein